MKKCLFFMALTLLLTTGASQAQKKFSVYGVGFYNLENLFDTCHDAGKNDYEYLPEGTNRWSGLKYTNKLKNMARVLSEMGTDKLPGIGCAAIGVSEVENAKCLEDLCNQEPLKARNVKLVPYIYILPEDSARATRGFLTVSGTLAGEHVTIVVNHLPSRGATSFYREEGGRQIRLVVDSLVKDDPNVKILVMGDMNDDPQDKSMAEALGAKRKMKDVPNEPGGLWNPWWDILASGTGTLQYDGKWNLFDQIIVSNALLDRDGKKDYKTLKLWNYQIFRRDYLFQKEGKYKGNTLRTHAGGAWLNGYSDHLPTVVYLIKEQNK